MIFKKENLVDSISKSAELTKAEANRQLDNTLKGLETQLEGMKPGDKLQLVGKFTIEINHKEAHDSQNPRTKEPVRVEAKNTIKIKAGSDFVKAIQ